MGAASRRENCNSVRGEDAAPTKVPFITVDIVATDPSSTLPHRRLDWSAPFSVAMVLLLALLVLMPMFWLSLTSLRNDAKQFTLEHYRQLFVDPSLLTPLLTTLDPAASALRQPVVIAALMLLSM